WLAASRAGQAMQAGAQAWVSGDALGAYPALAAALTGPDSNLTGIQLAGSLRANATAVAHIALGAWQRGDTVRPDDAAPLYVRDKVAFTTAERHRGAGGNPR